MTEQFLKEGARDVALPGVLEIQFPNSMGLQRINRYHKLHSPGIA